MGAMYGLCCFKTVLMISCFVGAIAYFDAWELRKWNLLCTWVKCATFLTDRPGRQFLFIHWPEKHKLGRRHWDLASCQVSWIPFGSFREEVENSFAGKVFQQIVGIPMGTNCAPLLADMFLYSYEAEFIQSLLSAGKKRLASQFNFTYRYIDDVLSINNPDFENYLGQMYPPELEIKDTTESNTSASYLDLLLSIGRDGHLRTSLYDKRDDFNFHITNFPFLSSNIPSSPAYGVFRVPSHFWSQKYRNTGIFSQKYRTFIGIFTEKYRDS